MTKKRKYNESYISLVFINTNSQPQCVLCCNIFPNSSMVPTKLRRHLETNHKDTKDKLVDFFIRKRNQLMKNKNFVAEVSQTVNKKATKVS